ncbi:MAG: nucleotidyltransferase domain-containing protein, partial [Thermoanaerobaculales bacterium]|nr:nucleotidyltransferase domain-containing protein [Thermoanaerobaculales bacterium]
MKTPDQIADIERRIAAQFQETDSPEIASVYLFGSYADGRAHRESDIDIGVLLNRDILPTSKERFQASLRLGTMMGAALFVDRVDLVVLNDAPPLIGRRIVTDGRRIYCRDPEIDH